MDQHSHLQDSALSTPRKQPTADDIPSVDLSCTQETIHSVVTISTSEDASFVHTGEGKEKDDIDGDELRQHVQIPVESGLPITTKTIALPQRPVTAGDDINDRVMEEDAVIEGDDNYHHRPVMSSSLNDNDIISSIIIPPNRPTTAGGGSTSSSYSLHNIKKYKNRHTNNIVAAGGRTILFGVASAQGERKTMEDTHSARLCGPQRTTALKPHTDTREEDSEKGKKKMEICISKICSRESICDTPRATADDHLELEGDTEDVIVEPTPRTTMNEKENDQRQYGLSHSLPRDNEHNSEISYSGDDEDIHQEIPFFAVYDGHGGTKCSEYLKAHLEKLALSHPYITLNPEVALTEAIERVDREFLSATNCGAHGWDLSSYDSKAGEDRLSIEPPSTKVTNLEKKKKRNKKKKRGDFWTSGVVRSPTHSSPEALLQQSSSPSPSSHPLTLVSKGPEIPAAKVVPPYQGHMTVPLADIDPSGSTAAVVVIVGNKIITANVGDTEVVMSSTSSFNSENKCNYTLLSCKHSLKDNPTEQERVKCAGGRIHQNRLGHPHYSPALLNLGVCRAIGDAGFKLPCFTNPQILMSLMMGRDGDDNDEKKPVLEGKPSGLIATPSTSVVELGGRGVLKNDCGQYSSGILTERDEAEQIVHDFVIIGCDGLWDVVSYREAVDHCRGFLIGYTPSPLPKLPESTYIDPIMSPVSSNNNICKGSSRNDRHNVNNECDNNRNPAQEACESLVKLALAKGSSDNVTVLVVVILGETTSVKSKDSNE